MDSNSSTGATKRFDGMLHNGAGNGENGQMSMLRSSRPRALTPKEAHSGALFCLLDGPAELALEGLNIEELCVVNGANRLFSCLDDRFPDLETHDKIGESLDNVFRLRVDKGERTAAYTGRCRELFEKAAREGIELPAVALGYLMLRGPLVSGTQDFRSGSCRTVVHGAKRCTGASLHFSDQLGCDQGVCSRHGPIVMSL